MIVPYPFVPPRSGGARVCFQLAVALSRVVKTYVCSTPQSESVSFFDVAEAMPRSRLKYINPFISLKISRWLLSHNSRVCILNHVFLFLPVYLACRFHNIKLIVYSHNLEYRRFPKKLWPLRALVFALERFGYRNSHKVFFISKVEMESAIIRFNLVRDACILVPHIMQEGLHRTQRLPRTPQMFSIVFFGSSDFKPNLAAYNSLATCLAPLMKAELDFPWEMTIFGSGDQFSSSDFAPELPVQVLGFVPDHLNILQESDLLLTPVNTGTGVQTKIIEAISLGLTVLSANSGIRGIDQQACGSKLVVVGDTDWHGYVYAIKEMYWSQSYTHPTPRLFFSTYGEECIIPRVMNSLEN
jgi:polysaccharide biosynthesis protein PslH